MPNDIPDDVLANESAGQQPCRDDATMSTGMLPSAGRNEGGLRFDGLRVDGLEVDELGDWSDAGLLVLHSGEFWLGCLFSSASYSLNSAAVAKGWTERSVNQVQRIVRLAMIIGKE